MITMGEVGIGLIENKLTEAGQHDFTPEETELRVLHAESENEAG